MKQKKQQPVKRKYTKKGSKNSIPNLEWIEPPKPIVEEKDIEVEQLTLICEVIENWSEPQKARCLQFLFSKYNRHFNPFKA